MIKPIKMNYPYHHNLEGVSLQIASYRGQTIINEIQSCLIGDMYNKIYKLEANGKNLSDKKRLLIQKEDICNKDYIKSEYYND